MEILVTTKLSLRALVRTRTVLEEDRMKNSTLAISLELKKQAKGSRGQNENVSYAYAVPEF